MTIQDYIVYGVYFISLLYGLFVVYSDIKMLFKRPKSKNSGHRRTHISIYVEFLVIQLMIILFMNYYSIWTLSADSSIYLITILMSHFNYILGRHLNWELKI